MIFDIYSVLGWIGLIFIILSYILFSTKKLKKDYVLYHLLNFIGAAGLIISTFMTESWPALTLGFIFAAISIVYIVKILSTKHPYKEFRLE
jgi:Kef-type K+ transport system membrane component KefB